MLLKCIFSEKKEANFDFSLDKVQLRNMQKIVWSDTLFIFITDVTDSYVKKKKRHAMRHIPKTHMWLLKSNTHPAIAFGIQNYLLQALFSIAFLFCKLRDTRTRGLFHFINIFVPILFKCYRKNTAQPPNLSYSSSLASHHFPFPEL